MKKQLLLGLVLASLQPLRAQERFSVGPMIGLYVPASSFVAADTSSPATSRTYKHAIAPVFGAQATYWLSSRAAIGAVVGWSSSDVHESTGSTQNAATPAAVTVLAAFFTLRVNSLQRDNAFNVRLGVAQVTHRGEFFERFGEPGNVAGLLGVDATLPVGRHFSGSGGVDAYLYSLQLTAGAFEYEKRSVIDFVGRVGIAWTFGER